MGKARNPPALKRPPAPSAGVAELLQGQSALLAEVRSLRRQVTQASLRLAHQARILDSLVRDREVAAGQAMPATRSRRASEALADMRKRLGMSPRASAEALAARSRISEATKADWIREGLLIGSTELAVAWGCSRQALEQACVRNELFNLKIGNRRWYPASMLTLAASDVAAICLLWGGLPPVAKFIGWQARHASLGGVDLPQAVEAGRLDDALRVAAAFADESLSAHAEAA